MTTTEKLPMVTRADRVPGPRQGQWTYDDYVALPDDGKRYEIVNGVLYMTPSPSGAHQDAVFRFSLHLFTHVEAAGLGKVRLAPFDVRLAPNRVVQPDVLIVLNANYEKITDECIIGAPDLVVEVASPGTAIYDRHDKLNLYTQAGVPEYWIADPESHTVEVLVLQAGEYYSLGVYRGKAVLPSHTLPGFMARVEQFFA